MNVAVKIHDQLLSPCSSVRSRLVCPFSHFELLCNTTGQSLEWTIDFPNGLGVDDPTPKLVTKSEVQPIEIVISDSSVLLIMTRTSLSSLTSLLEINNTIFALNGTRIDCAWSGTAMFSTVVTIVGNGISGCRGIILSHKS